MAQSSSAAASTSSSSTAPNSDHDVFINHRGLDVKKNFASHLYRRLQSYGLRVFLDQPELQRGDYFAPQIEEAIRYASVHVAIFSSGYAESTWCLRELVLMLQSNSPVIPVFYKVKPEELRWTRGKEGGYAKALEELEKKTSTDPQTGEEKLRYDPSLIQNWRNALFEAAGISGFELEACNCGCKKVEVLPPQVLHQVSLRQLILRDTNIKELPSAIGELHDLEVLEVDALLCALPPSLCSLKSLKKLLLYDCKELKCLPASLGDLRNLKELEIKYCWKLESLPASFGQLAQLTELTVKDCPLIRELPFLPLSDLESSIDHCILPRLDRLDLPGTGISEVSFTEGVCSNLRTLIMERCNSLVDGCHSLRKMDNIYGLAKLHQLNISDCTTLVSLSYLYAFRCVKLKRIRGLGLYDLYVSGCSELEELEGIQHCMSLERVDARECPKLQWDAGVVEQLRQRMGSDFEYDYRRVCLEQRRQGMGSTFRYNCGRR